VDQELQRHKDRVKHQHQQLEMKRGEKEAVKAGKIPYFKTKRAHPTRSQRQRGRFARRSQRGEPPTSPSCHQGQHWVSLIALSRQPDL
jgi:hypothetical protein